MLEERLQIKRPHPALAIDAVWNRAPRPQKKLLIAHGAGAGMDHAFFLELVPRLNQSGITTLRFQFPFMQKGLRRVDSIPDAVSCLECAYQCLLEEAPHLPTFVAGKSYGARMASHAALTGRLAKLQGLIFWGFPLHTVKNKGVERAKHLDDIEVPMLFLTGPRDALCDLDLLLPRLEQCPKKPQFVLIPDADHSFKVRKKSGWTPSGIYDLIGSTTEAFMQSSPPLR